MPEILEIQKTSLPTSLPPYCAERTEQETSLPTKLPPHADKNASI